MNVIELLLIYGDHFRASAVYFFRLGAVISVSPAFGSQMVSQRFKLGVALLLSNLFAILAPVSVSEINSSLIFGEVFIGLIFGLGLRFLAWTLQIAGTVAAQATSLSQLLGDAAVEPTPAIGQILTMGGLALFFILDFHLLWIIGLLKLYDLFPVGLKLSGGDVFVWSVGRVAGSMQLAVQLAAPFLILSILYNLTLGIINKAMPQLMVAFVGAPVITFGGLVFLFLSAAAMLAVWGDAVRMYLFDPMNLVQ